MTADRLVGRRSEPAALIAAFLAFASAAVTLYWLLGGTAGLETVGGEVERIARSRSGLAITVASITLAAKLVAGGLALVLAGPRQEHRSPIVLGFLGGGVLTLYGGVLVVIGALVLAGVIDPSGPVDEYALRWHVFVWDLWFFVWGVAFLLAAVRAHRRSTGQVRSRR